MSKETERNSFSYEITLRAIGQALEALSVESFELVVDGDNFVLHGGPGVSLAKQKRAVNRGFRFFGRKPQNTTSPRQFYISGMRLRRGDVKRLDDQGKEFRISGERCPDTERLSHSLRLLGAHIDKSQMILLGIQKDKGVFTVWHKGRSEDPVKEVFTQANLYDLWVHLYKRRKGENLRRTGTN
jgi:hypothetical protein